MNELYPHISPVWTRYTPIVAERAEGAYVYDQDGTRYLDFTCGIGVTNTGHCHPKVVRAVQEQAAKLLHGQANIIFHPPLVELAEELRTVVPKELDCFFFSNSGAEARSSWPGTPPASPMSSSSRAASTDAPH